MSKMEIIVLFSNYSVEYKNIYKNTQKHITNEVYAYAMSKSVFKNIYVSSRDFPSVCCLIYNLSI